MTSRGEGITPGGTSLRPKAIRPPLTRHVTACVLARRSLRRRNRRRLWPRKISASDPAAASRASLARPFQHRERELGLPDCDVVLEHEARMPTDCGPLKALWLALENQKE